MKQDKKKTLSSSHKLDQHFPDSWDVNALKCYERYFEEWYILLLKMWGGRGEGPKLF